MSLCRWSCDSYRCDLYVYEGQDGYVTHVASGRYVDPPVPSPYEWDECKRLLAEEAGGGAWQRAVTAFHAALEACAIEPIDLPHAGASFYDPDARSLRQRLTDLRELGYRFPDYVMDAVEEDINEEGTHD